MARPETIETVGGGGNGPLPPHHPYRVPPPLPTGPILLSTSTNGTGISALHQNHDPLWLIYPTHTQPGSRDEPEARHRSSPTPPPPPACSRGSVVSPDDLSGEQPGSDSEEYQDRSSRRGPLPDLLPQNEHAYRASPRGGPGSQEAELRRVGGQLKLIGDEFNATFLRRAHNAPRWRDWRDVCRGLFNFITQTLSALYRLT